MKIYVAGPLNAGSNAEKRANIKRAMRAGYRVWQRGHTPYIPHLDYYFGLFLQKEYSVEFNWDEWMAWDKPWLAACDAILYLAPSPGADTELEYAIKTGKKIFYRIEDIPVEVR
jgi:hypothetical protein